MDPPSLQDYYRSVHVTPSTFFQNAVSMNKFDVAQSWSSLGKPVDRDEWGMTVPTVNACKFMSPLVWQIVKVELAKKKSVDQRVNSSAC